MELSYFSAENSMSVRAFACTRKRMKKCSIECNSFHEDADMSQRAVLGSGVIITSQDERTARSSTSRRDSGLEF